MIPTLTTKRLTLRAPRPDDLPAYTEYRMSDRAKTVGGPYTAAQAFEQLSSIIGHWTLRGFGRWMLADRETDAPLGIVGLYYPVDWPEPEIAWSVFANGEGRGLAHEAALAARDYAYGTLGWTTAISLIDPANSRSVALARRMGCVEDAPYSHPTYGEMHVWRHPAPEVLA